MLDIAGENRILSFEDFLVDKQLMNTDDFEKVRKHREETGDRFILSLHRLSILKGRNLSEAIAEYYNISVLHADDWPKEGFSHNSLSVDFLRENKICPVQDTPDGLILAMFDPSDEYALNAVQLALNTHVISKVATFEDIEIAIEKSNSNQDDKSLWVETPDTEGASDDVQHLKDIALGTPIVRFVNQLLLDAVRLRATDIHVEPFDNQLSIRMRIDGMLHEMESPSSHMAKAVVSRIKILSELNIAERRLPQDGRARIRIESQRMDLRVATIPTIYGEAVAIRLLDNIRRGLNFSKLGFEQKDEDIISRQLNAPYGMFVVTGPTGSGKTTTLATALTSLNQTHRKILTVEDPIEYELEGVNQTSVKPSIGLTFAAALRSFLRHDPDVIMVGEMRDAETANIGIHAALTGHLVLTTLHTNSAAGTIPRLLDMGIDAFLLASSLRCLVGQRLVRRLCDNCKESYIGKLELPLKGAGLNERLQGDHVKLWRPVGCDRCFNTGYSDRIVLSEVIELNEELQNMIKPGTSAQDIEIHARQFGMTTMLDDGIRKCLSGITTMEEVRRVVLSV